MTVEKSPAQSIFNKLREHGSAPRVDTERTMLDFIKEAHPDHHVTLINSNWDVRGFAKAGHADLKPVLDDGTWTFGTSYVPPRSRIKGGEGHFVDNLHFAQWQCHWQGTAFVVYCIRYQQDGMENTITLLLSPLEGQRIDIGHSPLSDAFMRAVGKWTSELHNEIYEFEGCWRKNERLYEAVQKSSWGDVILDPATKSNIISDVHSFFNNRALYEEFNIPWKRGIILHGTPGNGKTITIKALLHELSCREQDPVPSLYVKSLKSQQGKEASIRSVFANARNIAPCIMIFEDLDSLVSDDARTYFLNEVDGMADNNGILMIGTTNHLDKLDSAIAKRPSRFDRKYAFHMPADRERKLYAEFWQKKLQGTRRIDFNDEAVNFTVAATEGFSFAYMKELFVTSLLVTVGDSADQIEVVLDQEADIDDGRAAGPQFQLTLPKALEGNKFVEALFKQARVLRREMNSVDDEGKKEGEEEKKRKDA